MVCVDGLSRWSVQMVCVDGGLCRFVSTVGVVSVMYSLSSAAGSVSTRHC